MHTLVCSKGGGDVYAVCISCCNTAKCYNKDVFSVLVKLRYMMRCWRSGWVVMIGGSYGIPCVRASDDDDMLDLVGWLIITFC